jgi:hypothetical protein
MKTTALVCVISGKKNLFNTEYYNTKLSKFESEDILKKHYITQDVKRLLEKNLNVKEIRTYLKCDYCEEISDEHLANIKKYNGIVSKTSSFAPLSVFTCFETDEDVKEFLNSIK